MILNAHVQLTALGKDVNIFTFALLHLVLMAVHVCLMKTTQTTCVNAVRVTPAKSVKLTIFAIRIYVKTTGLVSAILVVICVVVYLRTMVHIASLMTTVPAFHARIMPYVIMMSQLSGAPVINCTQARLVMCPLTGVIKMYAKMAEAVSLMSLISI
jgi:hypothetical protein